jgi:hypothetical protein
MEERKSETTLPNKRGAEQRNPVISKARLRLAWKGRETMQITLPGSLTDRIGVKAARRRPDDTLTESAEFIAKLRHRWRINGIDHGMQWLLHKSAMKGDGILHKKRCEDDNARISSGQISHRLLPAIWECGRHVNHVDLPALKTQYRLDLVDAEIDW